MCLLFALPVAAKTITVTPATFDSAVASARGGDTLALVGNFGSIRIINRDFASNVTINASRATFSGTLTLNNVDNLTVSGGVFDISGAPAYTQAAAVYGGRNITFSAARMIGTAGGEGITFSGTTGAVVTNSTFTGLQVAVVLGSVTNGVATRNTITGSVSDGIDIANSHGVTASYNSCSGGNPGPGVHPDCVQLWSVTGQPLQSDIIVRNNTATGPTQGFTAFDSMGRRAPRPNHPQRPRYVVSAGHRMLLVRQQQHQLQHADDDDRGAAPDQSDDQRRRRQFGRRQRHHALRRPPGRIT